MIIYNLGKQLKQERDRERESAKGSVGGHWAEDLGGTKTVMTKDMTCSHFYCIQIVNIQISNTPLKDPRVH